MIREIISTFGFLCRSYLNCGLASLEDDRITLQAWDDFDSLFMAINQEYEDIYLKNNIAMEAEEVREDIMELEEFYFADSVLLGNETIVDSSGAMPITINKKVRLAIKYFQTTGRVIFTKWLERRGKYEGEIDKILIKKGLPEELKYIAMIESGFNPRARSYARAVGMWQFISATGRYYGLRHNWWFDERRDPYKATEAALTHFADLYKRFGDWYLALAGYNMNPRRVEKNMRRYNTRDFWKLRRLPRQTRNYVPTFLAATILAKNPKQFGFYVEKMHPIEVDTVIINESLDLNVIANIVDTSYAYIKEINPAVLRWVTPPGIKNFHLYVPKGKTALFEEKYAKIPDSQKRSWIRHKIRSGETISTIAQKYHTSMSVIKSTNHLKSSRIRAGKYLLIPVPQNKAHYYSYKQPVKKSKKYRSPRRKITNVTGHKKVIYMVKPGDTLGQIAEDYHTRASKIRSWNGLSYGRYIKPKQKLAIWVPKNSDERKNIAKKKITLPNETSGKYYTVKYGDTLWDIAKKYHISVSKLKRINNMRSSRIKPGDRIKIEKK